MLFLKSKELKSSNRNTFKIKGYSLFWLSALGFFSPLTHASEVTDLTSITQIASIFFSLLFVIAIIFGLAWIMRRFNVTHAGKGELKVVASLVAGTKERVIVIQVGEEQHLLGVTTHSINHLAHLSTPINTDTPNVAASGGFKDKLTQAMASRMNTNMQPPGDRS